MSTVSKPVILDETGKKLVAAIEGLALREGANKEILEEIKGMLAEISGKLGGKTESEVYIATVTETYNADNGGVTVDASGVTYAEIRAAFEAGKSVFLRVLSGADSDGNGSCLIPVTEVQDSNIKFMCLSAMGKNVKHAGLYLLTAENVMMYSANPLGAASVSCSVTIGGTKCQTLSDVLAVLAELHKS